MFDYDKYKKSFDSSLQNINNFDDLYIVKSSFIGKSGSISKLFKNISDLPLEQKKNAGKEINNLKNYIESSFDKKKEEIELDKLNKKLLSESIDITLPSRVNRFGKIHPLSYVTEELIIILRNMGFALAQGPEIESNYYNFNALNIPDHHPAREMHDSFYVNLTDHLLRTHTSSVQIRTLNEEKVPIKIMAPGRTYRADSDATHTPMFHQIEALYIDKNINFANLRYCINELLRKFFNKDISTRFRASYFPFTEPSAEVDISCKKKGNKILVGEGDDYLEILGCGMVHPKILENCNIDPNEYQGFAFGAGIERLTMLKYGISDLRDLFNNDARFLNHYGFNFEE